MSTYEFTFLLENKDHEEEIKNTIEEMKGAIKEQSPWGKKTLSYPIRKKSVAYYYTYKIELDPSSLSEFKKRLNFNDKIMRYLILKIH